MNQSAVITQRTLAECESLIERGLATFIEVGKALKEIRDRKLYKEQYFQTFEDYCQERWKLSRPAAYQYLAATEVVSNLSTQVDNPPSFTQARELSVLEPEQQREVAASTDFANTTVRELKEKIDEARGKMDVHYSSDSAEWYTPPEIIERTTKTLGRIDLDPCSPKEPTIPAGSTFTKDDNGLRFDWCGTVYMNPPYGREIGEWVEKLIAEHKSGRTQEAIALVPARVDTDWFRQFRDFAVCFVDGRLKFSGHENSAPFPSAVIYLGPNLVTFKDSFEDIGDVWVRFRG